LPNCQDITYLFCFTGAETEIHKIKDDSKIIMQTNLDRRGLRPIPIICHLLDPPSFSLPTTFKGIVSREELNGYKNKLNFFIVCCFSIEQTFGGLLENLCLILRIPPVTIITIAQAATLTPKNDPLFTCTFWHFSLHPIRCGIRIAHGRGVKHSKCVKEYFKDNSSFNLKHQKVILNNYKIISAHTESTEFIFTSFKNIYIGRAFLSPTDT
jgi:hypothetical protein